MIETPTHFRIATIQWAVAQIKMWEPQVQISDLSQADQELEPWYLASQVNMLTNRLSTILGILLSKFMFPEKA